MSPRCFLFFWLMGLRAMQFRYMRIIQYNLLIYCTVHHNNTLPQKKKNDPTNSLSITAWRPFVTPSKRPWRSKKKKSAMARLRNPTIRRPRRITTRTTYGMLLVMISFFLVAGAGAGATRSYLRDATASIVVSSERDSLSCPECEPDEQCCDHGENGKGLPGYCAVYCIF